MRSLTTALALLLGLLAMHAVSGGPHSPRGAEHSMAAPVAASMTVMAATADQAQAAAAVLVSTALASAVPETSGLPADVPGAMAAMCVALLLSVALLLRHRLLGRAPAARGLQRTGRRLPRLDGLLRAPPPDLLALNCVLRT